MTGIRSPITRRIATASAAAALAAAGLMFFAALAPGAVGLVVLDPGGPITLEPVLVVVLGIALLMLARGLWRGTRRAAHLGISGLVIAAVAAVSLGHGILAAVELTSACGLLAVRPAFRRGTAHEGTLRPALLAGTAALGAWLAASIALLAADQVTGARQAALAAGGWLLDGAWWLRSDAVISLTLDGLVLAALAGGGLLLRALLRPAVAHEGHSAAEHARAAAVVAEHACDSLDPFALRADKAFHFAHGGMLAYRTIGGTAVVSGEPIGPPASGPAILQSFAAESQARGWDVVLTGASGRHLDAYRRSGFRTLCIGEEAVVDPATFSLQGRRMRSVRQAINRQQRLGWSVELVAGDRLAAATVADLADVERRWRAAQPRLTGFAMTLGRLWGAPEDGRSLYALGRDPEGRVRAFVRFAAYRGGLSLDVMRRVGETPNGLTEALVAGAIQHAADHGLHAVSLNFAGFAHLFGDAEPATVRVRATRWLMGRARGRFQQERLVMFNEKFGPRWERRHLIYQNRLTLPIAGLRVLQAEAYVRSPRPRRLTARWEPRTQPVALAVPTALPAP